MHGGITALYLRLSREDDGIAESQSIGSQRQILRSYAEKEGMENLREYIDDGWSGTGADRPAFQQLLRDAEEGLLTAVLVKDLSRLGRNITLTTYLMDEFFPAHRIRCCAVGDGCDTASGDRVSRKMGVITNLMNEWYSEDLSCKIRDALVSKRRAGEYVGSRPPYGYRRDPKDRHHLIPDEAAAEVVQKIYALADEGCPIRKIALLLNAEGIPSPLSYRDGKNGATLWRPGTVTKMLHNPVYRGALAQGKSRKVSFKSRRVLSLPQEEWVICEHCHDPLVDGVLWWHVQKKVGKKK